MAKTGFAMRVRELEQSIQQYKEEQKVYQEKNRENMEILDQLRSELRDVDEKIKTLRPRIRLDSMDARCEWREERGREEGRGSVSGKVKQLLAIAL